MNRITIAEKIVLHGRKLRKNRHSKILQSKKPQLRFKLNIDDTEQKGRTIAMIIESSCPMIAANLTTSIDANQYPPNTANLHWNTAA